MNRKRIRLIKDGIKKEGPFLYWMSREQRVNDNWPLLFAQHMALEKKEPFFVLFCLTHFFPGANSRHYSFMFHGLKEVEKTLKEKNIPFYLLFGKPEEEIPFFIEKYGISAVVTDFSPLKIKDEWIRKIGEKINIPFYEVDGRNIVPCWIASPKCEYGAYTIRPKIHRLLPEFLTEFPPVINHPFCTEEERLKIDWNRFYNNLSIDRNISEITWLKPGEESALKLLFDFIRNKLDKYPEERNDPAKEAVSNLSPYLHFGQISAQRAALEVEKYSNNIKSQEAFLEELIVRRELADNFCYYNKNYDSFDGFPEWAKKSLNEHRKDERDYLYATEILEEGKTHDPLWNASQMEMVKRGKMHGYMRMYWAKKILEWTAEPEEGMKIAIYLNDKYELDGRDTNGYTGIAWSIGGVHDRAWGRREIFGKIRYMSYNGCKSKFDINVYIQNVADYTEV